MVVVDIQIYLKYYGKSHFQRFRTDSENLVERQIPYWR